jgi:hypothetical protein
MPVIPESQEALSDLSQLIPVVYSALEAAIQSAREFFDREGNRPIDPYLAPCLVRYYAKRFLIDAGCNAEYEDDVEHDEGDGEFKFHNLSNNGLALTSEKYQIRIWKSDDGKLPVPGPSQPRRAFFQQCLPYDMSLPAEQLGLAILWEVSPNYVLTRLLLSCPKAGDTSRASVEAYWTVPIPHPAFSAIVADQSEDHVEEFVDLPISKPVDAQAEQAE